MHNTHMREQGMGWGVLGSVLGCVGVGARTGGAHTLLKLKPNTAVAHAHLQHAGGDLDLPPLVVRHHLYVAILAPNIVVVRLCCWFLERKWGGGGQQHTVHMK